MVQWLHISDLHFQPNTDPDQESLIRALLADCRSRKIQADFVGGTGGFHCITVWDTLTIRCLVLPMCMGKSARPL